LEDVDSGIPKDSLQMVLSLEHGQSITLFLKRADNAIISKFLEFFFLHLT